MAVMRYPPGHVQVAWQAAGRLKSQQQVPQACLRRLHSSRRGAASGMCCCGFNRPCPKP